MSMHLGEILAKVWYSKKEKMELNQISVKKTGNEEKRYEINFNNFKINLYKTLPNFEKCDKIYEERKLKLFSDFYLPISLGISTFYELKEEKLILKEDEAKKILEEKLKSELSEEIQDKTKINDIKVNIHKENDSVEVEVIYEVLENIGTEEKIIF